MKRPLAWLLISVLLLFLTPFTIFPEIMGDVGPRNVPLWRNALALGLLCGEGGLMGWSLAALARRRRLRGRATPAARQ